MELSRKLSYAVLFSMLISVGCAANADESSALESLLPGFIPGSSAGANHLEIARYPMRHMTERGYPTVLSLFDSRSLPAVIEKNPRLPTDPNDLIDLAHCVYSGEVNGRPCGDVYVLRSNRLEIPLTGNGSPAEELLFLGLRNSRIDDVVREVIDRAIAKALPLKPYFADRVIRSRVAATGGTSAATSMVAASQWPSVGPCNEYVEYDASPAFQTRYCITDKFWIAYYYGPGFSYPDSAILSDEIIFQLAADLEVVWNKYEAEFGPEHLPELYEMVPGYNLLQIDFLQLAKGASTANGVTNSSWQYIALNPRRWNEIPGIRKPVSAHELFHRVQYRYGYSVNPDYDSADWFVEGTAAMAEALVWNRTSANYKYTWLYEHPIADFNFSDAQHPWGKYAPAAADFWYFWDRHLGAMPALLKNYETNGDILASLDAVLYDRFGAAGVFNNFTDYLALWRRDKIVAAHAPIDVINELDQPVGPLQVELRRTKHFTPATASSWNGVVTMYANGTSYAMLYVDPLLKSGAQSLRFGFNPSDPDVPMQYQLVFAKCLNGLVACGVPDSGWLETNVPRGDYQVVRTIYPFFSEHDWEYILPLDSSTLDWDLVYIVSGNRAADSGQEYLTIGAELWDNP